MTQQSDVDRPGGDARRRTAPGGATRGGARLLITGLISLGAVVSPLVARAEPLPLEASLRLTHPVTVHVGAEGSDTHVVARAGRHVAEAIVPVVLEDASAERIDTTRGPTILVRGRGAGRSYAWIVVERRGAPAIVWSGRTDLHGDPGERVADAIETLDRTGDGRPDVVVGQVREGVTTCGSALALAFPSALDDVGELRPVSIGRVGADRVDVAATAVSPGPTPPPVGTTLRVVGATSALGVTDAASLGTFGGLGDGDPATGWIEGRAGAGPGELVSLRIDAPRAVRAIALVRSTAAGVDAPRSVFVVGDTGSALHVTLPDVFDRAWIVLPEPQAWTCVALVIERGPTEDAAEHVGLGEIEAYTELDFGGGVATLVESLVAEGADAERTADWLARAGGAALDALALAWDRLSALGHRRALRVAAAHASAEPALRLLALGAVDDDDDVQSDALAVLAHAGSGGARTLVEVAAGDRGEPAARTLALSREPFDVAPLLRATSGGGSERPWLRAAIGARAGREPRADVDAAIAAWLPDAPPGAIAAVALATSEARPDLARDLVTRAIPAAAEFRDRYRLALASRHATVSAANDAWLTDVATHAEEWMLRAAALEALALRSTLAIAAGLSDASPRVRRTAVASLAADPASTDRLIDRATRDPWPLVRVAALEALAHRDAEITTLRGRLADRSPMVRARAIELLTERADHGAWPLLAPIFADDDEWPRVTAAALGLASAFCVPDATVAVEQVMRRGTRQGAWAPHVDVAVEALRIAIRLGGETAARARAIATESANEAFAPVLAGQGALEACPVPAP